MIEAGYAPQPACRALGWTAGDYRVHAARGSERFAARWNRELGSSPSVHAAWLGHPLAGDKIYGPDETLFLEFIQSGWTERHAAMLPLPRHALHASEWSYQAADLSLVFQSPLPGDWQALLGNMTACS
jgi:hypothetical protein